MRYQMSRADEIHRLKILSAMQTRRTINISQRIGDPLLGVVVIDFDEDSGNITIKEELTGNTASISIYDVNGTSFEYLVYDGGNSEPLAMHDHVLQQHFNDIVRLVLYDGTSYQVQRMLWVHDKNNQVVFVDDASIARLESISNVREIHIR